MNYKIFKTDLKPWLKKFFFEKFSYIVKTITGTIITITDGIRKKVNELKLSKESTQESTTGKNKLSYPDFTNETTGNITFKNNKGIYTISTDGTSTSPTSTSTYSIDNYTIVDGDYIHYNNDFIDSHFGISLKFSDGTNAFNSFATSTNRIISLSSYAGKTITGITFNWNTGYSFNGSCAPMICNNSTATDFEEYTGGIASPNPNYQQEIKTVTGYRNLLDLSNFTNQTISGIKFTKNSDSSITMSGTSTNSITFDVPITNIDLNKDNIYVISQKNKYNVGARYAISLRDNNGTVVDTSCSLDSGVKYKTFTVSTNKVAKYFRIYVPNNVNIETTIYPAIVEGSQELPYVPYGSNWIYTKITGKNLFNRYDVDILRGRLDIDGSLVSSTAWRTVYIKCNKNTDYTISGVTTTNDAVCECIYDENMSFISSPGRYRNQTFTTPANAKYLGISVDINDLGKFQIEESSTATSYEPYKENIIPLPLNGNEIAGTDTTKDEYIIDKNGNCYLDKKIEKIILDSNYDITMFTTPITYFKCILEKKASVNNNVNLHNLCNRYISVRNSFDNLRNGVFSISSSGDLSICDDAYNSVEEFKNSLANNKIICYYKLENKYLIDLNYTVDIRLFKGTNNISNSDDMDMSIKYYSK